MSLSLLPTVTTGSFSECPLEIKEHISSFITPSNLSREEVKSCGRQLVNLSRVNKEMKASCYKQLSKLKRIHELLNKYYVYQNGYENPGVDIGTKREFDPKGNPQLLDALFTGCRLPFARSTYGTYSQEIEKDIIDIVRLTPQSLHCRLGTLRCRDEVPPLLAACINLNIPVHIVEFLFKNGANPNATVQLCCEPKPIIEDLKKNINADRFSKISELFKKYGLNV